MARVPSSVKLSYGQDSSGKPSNFPLISSHNVYVFPGVPQFLEEEFSVLESLLLVSNSKKRFFLRKIFLSADETAIASILDEVDEKFKGIVHLGSYPNVCNQEFKVKLTVESDSVNSLEEAWHYLLARLPANLIVKTEGVSDASILNCKCCIAKFSLPKGKRTHCKITITPMGWEVDHALLLSLFSSTTVKDRTT